MKTQQDYINFFEKHSETFWVSVINELKNDFKEYQNASDYNRETFPEMLDEVFWTMGCDYGDYAITLFDNYFSLIMNETDLEKLKDDFMESDFEYMDLGRLIFDTFIIKRIKDIIIGGKDND